MIMVDEAHERSLSTDILLGILKKIRKKRPELRIVISSATLQATDFARFFETSENDKEMEDGRQAGGICQIISLEGRMYPVDILYLEEPSEDYVEKAVQTVFDIHASEPDGDILVFLTGREEIDSAIQQIADNSASIGSRMPQILALPLYAGLTSEQQLYVFEPAPENTRKVIVATNIAEASVTIDGIVYVVDCGFVKLRAFNPRSGIETLTATPVSQASATQRAGRAGRTKPGKCFRLYTESAYHGLSQTTVPEIQRSNLAPVLLQLKALGIDNIVRFGFLTPPPAELVIRALELLFSLGAIDEYAKLTRPLGTRMAELSVEPMMAKVLLTAPSFQCLSEMLSIAAMTSLQGAVWFQNDGGGDKKAAMSSRRKFAAEEGDHLTLLNVYQAFVTKARKDAKWCRDNYLNHKSMLRAVSVRAQLKRYLERFGLNVDESLSPFPPPSSASTPNPDPSEQIRKCLTAGYFAHAARMQPDGTFRPISGNLVLHAHPSSLMFVSSSVCLPPSCSFHLLHWLFYPFPPLSTSYLSTSHLPHHPPTPTPHIIIIIIIVVITANQPTSFPLLFFFSVFFLTPKQNRKANWVIFHEVLETGSKTFIRDITKIEKSWLLDPALSGTYYQVRE